MRTNLLDKYLEELIENARWRVINEIHLIYQTRAQKFIIDNKQEEQDDYFYIYIYQDCMETKIRYFFNAHNKENQKIVLSRMLNKISNIILINKL